MSKIQENYLSSSFVGEYEFQMDRVNGEIFLEILDIGLRTHLI